MVNRNQFQRSPFIGPSHSKILSHPRRHFTLPQVDHHLGPRPKHMDMRGRMIVQVLHDRKSALTQEIRQSSNDNPSG